MIDAKHFQLIDRLHDKTMSGKIEWKKGVKDEAFQTVLRDYTVQLLRQPSRAHPEEDLFVLRLLDNDGEVVDEFTDEDFGENVKHHAFNLLNATHSRARMKAMGVDKVLDDLLDELG